MQKTLLMLLLIASINIYGKESTLETMDIEVSNKLELRQQLLMDYSDHSPLLIKFADRIVNTCSTAHIDELIRNNGMKNFIRIYNSIVKEMPHAHNNKQLAKKLAYKD